MRRFKTPALLLMLFAAALSQKVDYNPQIQNPPGLLSDQQRVPFANFYAACSAAAAAGKVLAVTKSWVITTTAACSSQVVFFGGILRPTSTNTVTVSVQDAPLTSICDISGGTCNINSAAGVIHPEWAGCQLDGATNCKPSIDWAVTQNQPTQLQPTPVNPYRYTGKMTALAGSLGKKIFGAGAVNTTVLCTDSSQTACIEIANSSTTQHLTLEGFWLQGPGMSAGTMRGFYSHGGSGANSNYTFRDMRFSYFSSDCLSSIDAFMTKYYDTYATSCGADGIVSGGDQSATFINAGLFTSNTVGYCLTVLDGSPLIQGWNCGSPLGGGAHFGGGAGFVALPNIIGLNIEGVSTSGGEGITFEAQSNFGIVSGSAIQLYCDGVVCGDAIHWKNPMGPAGMLVNPPAIIGINAGSWASPAIVVDGCSTNEGLYVFGIGAALATNSTPCIYQWIANGQGLMQSAQPLSTLSKGTATMSSGVGTSNTQDTVVTTDSLTTAAGMSYQFELINSTAFFASGVTCSPNTNPALSGANTTGRPVITECYPRVGNVIVTIANTDPSAAFNGTLTVFVEVKN